MQIVPSVRASPRGIDSIIPKSVQTVPNANGIISADETIENATDKMPPKTLRATAGVVDGYGVPNATRHRAYLSDCLSRMGGSSAFSNGTGRLK